MAAYGIPLLPSMVSTKLHESVVLRPLLLAPYLGNAICRKPLLGGQSSVPVIELLGIFFWEIAVGEEGKYLNFIPHKTTLGATEEARITVFA